MSPTELDRARSAGAVDLVPYTLGCLSELDFRTGRWDAVYAGAAEAVELAEETGQRNVLAFGLVCLARVEAATGRADACRRHVARALELAGCLEIGSIPVYGLSVLGLLELGLGDAPSALASLDPLAALVRECGLRDPSVVQWTPDLVEASILAGRVDEAGAALAGFEREARATERTWALAACARCRGMLGSGDFEREFAEALRWHEYLPAPFERARTELRLGERLRRARRPLQAREALRAALATFERLGAAPWAERARAELAAAGERSHRHATVPVRELTAQELRVALLVAGGATNREAAVALFLSPKTVGFHLGKVYTKLGVRSRTELAALLARESTLETGGSEAPQDGRAPTPAAASAV